MIAVIAQAIWNLRRTVFKAAIRADGTLDLRQRAAIWPGVLLIAVALLYMAGVSTLLLLFGGAAIMALTASWLAFTRWRGSNEHGLPVLGLALGSHAIGQISLTALGTTISAVSLPTLFLTFLKIGSLIYGSGYVLLAFLKGDLVQNLHWLTDKQLLDAISVGQLTPGPVFTTATFIGYTLGGLPGELLATLAIFLSAFVLIVLVHPLAIRLRRWPLSGQLLDGVNSAAVGLMVGVLLQLSQTALIDPLTVALAVIALIVLVRFRLNATWLIAAGALVGLARFALVS